MINRGATLVSHLAVLIAVMFTLTACGGGGGGSTFYDEDGSSSSSSSSGTSSSSGSSSGGDTPTLALALFNAAGEATDTVSSGSPGTLTVSIPGGDANVLISAETEIGTLLPASGTALTNLLGVATFQITAGLEAGVGTVTAKATTSAGDLSGNLTINVLATSISLALFDPEGNETNTVTSSAPGTLRATIAGSGANVLVSASAEIGVLFPASGTALTNDDGVASFQIEAGTEKGAGNITATATTSAGSVSNSLAFQVGDSGLRLGSYDDDAAFIENRILIEPNSTLSAGGNAQLSVVVLNAEGNRVTTAEDVRFSSGCIAAELATINPTVSQSINGQASTLYSATGCSGTDNITASLVGADAQAFGTMTIAGPTTNAIEFVSAEPLLIVLSGTGGQGRDETSTVVFRVVDGSGSALPGVTVNFSLTTYIGGLSLSKTSSLSDGDGQVSVTVQSGDIPTVVRVLATVDGGSSGLVTTVSDLLTVTTGLPDQNSISLAVGDCGDGSSFVVDGAMTIFGLCRQLTVAMADKFNNPVVDGTAAVFTTEYGSIVGSCTTVGGTCSVNWSSQQPRFPTLTGQTYVLKSGQAVQSGQPTSCRDSLGVLIHSGPTIPCPVDLGYIRGGRSTILVTAIGEESFADRNGNGVMDENEQTLFENMPEAFLDENEDGVYTPALPQCPAALTSGPLRCIAGQEETFVDFNANGVYDYNDSPAWYNGLLCPEEGDGVWCSRELINVRADHVVTLGAAPNWRLYPESRNTNGTAETVDVYLSDIYNNPPPGGATVTVSALDNCKVIGPSAFEVPNYGTSGAFEFAFSTLSEIKDPIEQGSVEIKLTTPVSSTSWFYNCVYQ